MLRAYFPARVLLRRLRQQYPVMIRTAGDRWMLAFPRVGRCPTSARRRRKEREPPLWKRGGGGVSGRRRPWRAARRPPPRGRARREGGRNARGIALGTDGLAAGSL